ncbi:MAG: carbohydrate kinase [Flavobacteriaceae bacterium]|nr:MAG: carbohydrate kinase [Flavobacteriaceae bacterium]
MVYIGFDIGSSSVKAALLEVSTGKCLGVVQEPESEMGMIAHKNGWAEQHPEDWWNHVCTASQKLLKTYNISNEKVSGIGISYQMHGLVVVDKEGKTLRPSIIWCDSRAVEIGNQGAKELGKDYCDHHLLNTPGNFTASKLKWVKENEPELYQNIHKCMLPGDYISYRFSGEMNTTISGLSEGIFWDFKKEDISKSLMDNYALEMDLIPERVPTFGLQGKVDEKGAAESGLAVGTPIFYRAGDQPNNALSLGVLNAGEVAATAGTSGVVYAVTDSLLAKETSKINHFAHVNYAKGNPKIGKLLCINGVGIQYRWLQANLEVESYTQMNALAESVPVGSEGLFVLPFGNGAERMFENRQIGSHFLHLNLNVHNKAHLCRAALEGIAFSFVYGMELLKKDGVNLSRIKAGNDNMFRSEIFADTISTLLGIEIEIFATTGAIGAARAAGLHSGDFETFRKNITDNDFDKRFVPQKEKQELQKAYEAWKKELEAFTKRQETQS